MRVYLNPTNGWRGIMSEKAFLGTWSRRVPFIRKGLFCKPLNGSSSSTDSDRLWRVKHQSNRSSYFLSVSKISLYITGALLFIPTFTHFYFTMFSSIDVSNTSKIQWYQLNNFKWRLKGFRSWIKISFFGDHSLRSKIFSRIASVVLNLFVNGFFHMHAVWTTS